MNRKLRALWKLQKRRCIWCGEFCRRDDATVDHVIPKYHNAEILDNKVCACRECNQRRGMHQYMLRANDEVLALLPDSVAHKVKHINEVIDNAKSELVLR